MQGSTLKFFAIEAKSSGDPRAPYDAKYPIYEAWENFKNERNSELPEGVNKAFQTAPDYLWCWMMTERAFLRGAIQGIIISITFAFVVLLFATFNLIVGVISILSIGFIVTSVISVMIFAGWELGVSESVAVVILIGFSVDYVVHLASHYVHSPHHKRKDRMHESLAEMGVSIFSGAVTTFGAGIFLFGAVIIIFTKFAVLIVSTILFSLVYAMLFFSSVMFSIGPEGETGSLKRVFRMCGICKGRGKKGVSSD